VTPTSSDEVCEHDHPVLRLELDRNLDAPALARAAVARFCDGQRLVETTMATLKLLVSEIVTNAVVHPDVSPPGTIGLYGRIGRASIRIEVSDSGEGFDHRPRDPRRQTGGFGLYLLDKESSSWGVDHAPHTVVWFEVDTATQ
jgi:anti-sigma regulatory factor (Ser/Thr protein kinase)